MKPGILIAAGTIAAALVSALLLWPSEPTLKDHIPPYMDPEKVDPQVAELLLTQRRPGLNADENLVSSYVLAADWSGEVRRISPGDIAWAFETCENHPGPIARARSRLALGIMEESGLLDESETARYYALLRAALTDESDQVSSGAAHALIQRVGMKKAGAQDDIRRYFSDGPPNEWMLSPAFALLKNDPDAFDEIARPHLPKDLIAEVEGRVRYIDGVLPNQSKPSKDEEQG